jgi:hypothetical protein
LIVDVADKHFYDTRSLLEVKASGEAEVYLRHLAAQDLIIYVIEMALVKSF